LLPERFPGDPNLRARLEQEARVISQLSHPNICALYDVGHEGDIDFLVMEFLDLDGETLFDRLRRGPLPIEEALKVAAAIARALDRAHKKRIVHRDIKPGNVMLTPGGPRSWISVWPKTSCQPAACRSARRRQPRF